MTYRVWLLANEYTNHQAPSPLSKDVWVAEFDRYGKALAYVKGSGYVQELAGWTRGAKWQTCYRIEKVAA